MGAEGDGRCLAIFDENRKPEELEWELGGNGISREENVG